MSNHDTALHLPEAARPPMSYADLMRDLAGKLELQMRCNPTGKAIVYLWPSVAMRPGTFHVCDETTDRFNPDPYAGWHLNGPRLPVIVRPPYAIGSRWETIAYANLYGALYEACRREPCMGPGDAHT